MKQKKSKLNQDTKLFYLYISPWLIGLTLFTLVPMLLSLTFSFTSVKMASATTENINFIGLKNYIDLFTNDSDFVRSISNTFVYAGFKVIFTVMIALFIALLLNGKVIGRKWFRTMIYLPAIIPVVSVALLWKMIFTGNEMNIANFFLSYLGLAPVNFFGSASSSMGTLIFIGVWSGLGPVMLILLASIQGIPQDMVEAAELDGVNALSKLRYIIIPTISPTLFFVALTGLIGSLQAYAEIKLLTDGGPGVSTLTMNLLIVRNAFNNLGRKTLGYASAQGWIAFGFSMILTIFFLKTVNKRVHYETGGDE
ncbi:MAG: sugar ABC transporter permease [Acholeplasmataceae bacterium]|jgi:multiple sugar transport system permease protein|nr:sugar ABC transporter permease [Acholeplasmataceae bacterium]